jgi:hypothetical protein
MSQARILQGLQEKVLIDLHQLESHRVSPTKFADFPSKSKKQAEGRPETNPINVIIHSTPT